MEVIIGERGQVTLPKIARDALGLSKGMKLTVEIDHGRIIMRKNVREALERLRGSFKLPAGMTTDDVMRDLRGRAPGDPIDDATP